MLLSLVLLASGEIGAGQVELCRGRVERVQGHHGGVFADGARVIVLPKP